MQEDVNQGLSIYRGIEIVFELEFNSTQLVAFSFLFYFERELSRERDRESLQYQIRKSKTKTENTVFVLCFQLSSAGS